jgi:hypothetical protein
MEDTISSDDKTTTKSKSRRRCGAILSRTMPPGGVFHYPSGNVAVVVNAEDNSTCFYADQTKSCLANMRLGVGFVAWPNGNPRVVFTASGGSLCSPDDGSATETWEWKTGWPGADPLSIPINSYLQLIAENQHDIVVTFRTSGGVTESFECGAPGSNEFKSYLDTATRTTTGALSVMLDPSKHPSLVDRQRSVSDPAKAAYAKAQQLNDVLPRLSSSGRELASVELPVSLLQVKKNHAWTTGPLADYTTDIGNKVKLIKEKTSRHGMEERKKHRHDAPESPAAEAPATEPPRQKRVLPKKVPLRKVSGRKVTEYVGALRSDQVCCVLAVDGGRESRDAEKIIREFIARSVNSVLQLRRVCATETDVPKIVEELDNAFLLAESLADKTLPKKYSFNGGPFPMFIFYMGGRLVGISNRLSNGAITLQNLELALAKAAADARSGAFLPEDYRIPTLADATFASIV